MRVLVLEFVTSGGMRDEVLPPSLVAEATLIRDAMLRDLAALPRGIDVHLTGDDRLPLPPGATPVGARADAWALWRSLAAGADLVWPVAPETGGVLGRLVEMLEGTGAHVLASRPEAIRAATSKLETARRLARAGLPHIPTFAFEAAPQMAGPRITKPDDGAGCDATRLWPDGTPATPERPQGLVIQPYVAGEAASLTVLAQQGDARLLSANRQHIRLVDGHVSLAGLTVGGIADTDGRLAALARDVAATFPGLAGIFGIDILLTAEGPVVVEVNPRLTTAYAGLGEALGLNPASLLAELAAPAGAGIVLQTRAVELALA